MSVDKSFQQQILKVFGPSTKLSDEEYDKLHSLTEIFHVDAEELYLEWESFNVAEVEDDLDLNLANLLKFHEFLQKKLTNNKLTPSLKKTSKEVHSVRKPLVSKNVNSTNYSSPNTPQLKKRKVDFAAENNASSPAIDEYETANTTLNSSPIKQSRESHKLIECLNPHIDLSSSLANDERSQQSVRLTANFDPTKYKFRTLQMKLLESADMLDDQIDTMAEVYQKQHPSSETHFGNPCVCSQFDILCCGRIVPDSPTYNDKEIMNSSSLFLETSRITGVGQRVALDLTSLSGYSLFPGQIVVLKGKNPTGKVFLVNEVVLLPQLGNTVSTREELVEFNEIQKSLGLKMVIASGPYSNLNKLDYSKFEKFVDKMNNDIRPNVIILNGPFFDLTNKAVEEGDFSDGLLKDLQPRNLEEVFSLLVTPILKKINPETQVILIPSLKDSCVSHCSYPQDAFDRKKLQLPKHIKVFPNPSSFAVNEILVGSSNLDVFKDLRDVYKETKENVDISSNRFERIINHIFDQKRYYPVMPGSIASTQSPAPAQTQAPNKAQSFSELSNGAAGEHLQNIGVGGSSLEVPYLGLAEIGDSLPDVMLLPSELKVFAKIVKGVVVINPGQFIRPNRSLETEDGTYVVMSVAPPRPEHESENNVTPVQDNEEFYYHNIDRRSRVDIYSS